METESNNDLHCIELGPTHRELTIARRLEREQNNGSHCLHLPLRIWFSLQRTEGPFKYKSSNSPTLLQRTWSNKRNRLVIDTQLDNLSYYKTILLESCSVIGVNRWRKLLSPRDGSLEQTHDGFRNREYGSKLVSSELSGGDSESGFGDGDGVYFRERIVPEPLPYWLVFKRSFRGYEAPFPTLQAVHFHTVVEGKGVIIRQRANGVSPSRKIDWSSRKNALDGLRGLPTLKKKTKLFGRRPLFRILLWIKEPVFHLPKEEAERCDRDRTSNSPAEGASSWSVAFNSTSEWMMFWKSPFSELLWNGVRFVISSYMSMSNRFWKPTAAKRPHVHFVRVNATLANFRSQIVGSPHLRHCKHLRHKIRERIRIPFREQSRSHSPSVAVWKWKTDDNSLRLACWKEKQTPLLGGGCSPASSHGEWCNWEWLERTVTHWEWM